VHLEMHSAPGENIDHHVQVVVHAAERGKHSGPWA
jgi:hypothetical protein